MPIPHYRTNDLTSFQETTKEPREIAGLYFYQILDCLIAQAYKVSADFRKRPQLYRNLGDPSLPRLLAELNAKYGTELNLLTASERNEIYAPVFGQSDAVATNSDSEFSRLRNGLVTAACAFAAGASAETVTMLRDAVRSAHRPFSDYLLELHGDSTVFSKDVSLSHLTENVAYRILRSPSVAAIFGIAAPVGAEYPYAEDPAGDLLVEQIAVCTENSIRRRRSKGTA
jgi:hypothetical protein